MNIRKIVVFGIVIILGVALLGYLVTTLNPQGKPPNFRYTIIDDKIFVRWTSNKSTVGVLEINGKEYKEDSPRMLHKLIAPYTNGTKHIIIKERINNKESASYCVDLTQYPISKILAGIYAGYGADTGSYRKMSVLLADFGVDTQFLIPKDLDSLYDLFKLDFIVFPGGRADHMISGLSLDQIENLRKYVAQGGAYIGICAGAYFASNYTVWQGVKYGDEAGYVLDLYYGEAVGPIKEIGDYDTGLIYNPQYPTNVTWYDGEIFNVTYWGGPYFTPVDNVIVIAEYEKVNKPAAIKFYYDSGRVLLFGFHPEFDTHYSQENRMQFLKMLEIEILWVAGV